MRCECLQYINKSKFHFHQNKNQTKINLKYKLSSKGLHVYVHNTNVITLLQTLGYWLIERSKLNQQVKIFCMCCLSDQLSSSKIISFMFSSSISVALSQSDCCSIRSASSMGIKSLSVQCTSNLPLLITHPLLSGDIVWLNQNFEAKLGLPTLCT